jgi:DNA topoisomerase-3
VLPKVVCLRPVSREEALAYFGEDGRTPMIEGWISKRGKPFTGALIRQESGRHRFEFPPRGKGRGAAAEEGPEGPGAEAAPAKAPKATKEPKAAKSTAKAPKATKEPKAAKASTKAPKAAAPAKGTTPAAPRTVRRAAKSEGT